MNDYSNVTLIICAAVKVKGSLKVWRGHRHNHALKAMNDELSYELCRKEIDKLEVEQGFITSTNHFVDRKEALALAVSAGQVNIEACIMPHIGLDSSDLY